ncbi:MAG: PLP-dependent aminotransferase family protein [Microbacterium sp.]
MTAVSDIQLPEQIRRIIDTPKAGLGIPWGKGGEAIFLGGGGTPAQELVREDDFADELSRVIRATPPRRGETHPIAAWIAQYESEHRSGQEVRAEQVVTTTGGGQRAIIDVVRALVVPGDVVAIEDPAYLGALSTLRRAGAVLAPIPVDEEGLRVDLLEERLREGLRPKLLYTVPTFQNPTGAELGLDRRRRIAELADRYGFLILEDDPYGDLRYRGQALPHIAQYAPERTIVVGTFSKTITTRWRGGWTVAPPALVPAVRAGAELGGGGPDYVLDAIANLLARPGWFADGVRVRTEVYGARLAALRSALRDELGDELEIGDPAGGLFLWLSIRDRRLSAARLAQIAAGHDLFFVQASPFVVKNPLPQAFRLTFAPISEERTREGVARLAAAVRAGLRE